MSLYLDLFKVATWKEEQVKILNSLQLGNSKLHYVLSQVLLTRHVILLGMTGLKARNLTNRLAPLKTKALFEGGHTHTLRFVLFCFDSSFEFQIPQIPVGLCWPSGEGPHTQLLPY